MESFGIILEMTRKLQVLALVVLPKAEIILLQVGKNFCTAQTKMKRKAISHGIPAVSKYLASQEHLQNMRPPSCLLLKCFPCGCTFLSFPSRSFAFRTVSQHCVARLERLTCEDVNITTESGQVTLNGCRSRYVAGPLVKFTVRPCVRSYKKSQASPPNPSLS